MFTPREREAIQLKAIEQALREAGYARMAPKPLIPTPRGEWPFPLSHDDRLFLKINKISPA